MPILFRRKLISILSKDVSSIVIVPFSTSYNRSNNFATVVFPDPVSPTIPTDDPKGMNK